MLKHMRAIWGAEPSWGKDGGLSDQRDSREVLVVVLLVDPLPPNLVEEAGGQVEEGHLEQPLLVDGPRHHPAHLRGQVLNHLQEGGPFA